MKKVFPSCILLITIFFSLHFIHPASSQEPPPEEPVLEDFPVDKEVQNDFDLGEGYFQNKEYDLAISAFTIFIQKHPQSTLFEQALFRIGESYLLKKEYKEATGYLKKILELPAPSEELARKAKYKLGVAYHEMKRINEALVYLEDALGSEDPEIELDIYKRLSRIYFDKKEYLSAIRYMVFQYNYAVVEAEKKGIEEKIRKIIEVNLKEKEVAELKNSFQYDFPGDIATLKLIRLYIQREENNKAEKEIDSFLTRYPHTTAKESLQELTRLSEAKVRIGCVVPLTGRFAPFGEEVLKGIELAVDLANNSKEETIRLIVKDSKGDPVRATSMVEELGRSRTTMAVVGPLFSKEVKMAAAMADEYEIPVITPSATIPDVSKFSRYVFRNSITEHQLGKAMAEYAVTGLGLKRFVVIYQDDHANKEAMRGFVDKVTELGGEIIAKDSFPQESVDFTDEIKRIKEEDQKKYGVIVTYPDEKGKSVEMYVPGFEAVYIPADYDKVGLLVSQLAFFEIKNVQFLGNNGWNSRELLPIAGRFLEGAVFVDGFFVDSPRPQVRDFVDKYRRRYQEDPSILSAQAYDSANLVVKSIRDGAQNRYRVKVSLQEVKDYPGASGITSFGLDRDATKSLFFIQIKGGKFVEIR